MMVYGALLNAEVFRRGYDILNVSTLKLTIFENTLVEGYVQCDRDGLLYTSIPQNGNWSVWVDGAPSEITLVGDAMVGVALSEGLHELRFVYRNEAYRLGWKISLGCIVLFALIYCYVYRPRWDFFRKDKRRGKWER